MRLERNPASAIAQLADATILLADPGMVAGKLAGAARTAFRGIAPVSGHEYEVDARRPLPVFMHHCADDTMVKPAGRCVFGDL